METMNEQQHSEGKHCEGGSLAVQTLVEIHKLHSRLVVQLLDHWLNLPFANDIF